MDPNAPGASLIKRLQAREPAAFDEVYALLSQPLFEFTRRLCGRDVGADVYQETWLQLVRHAPRLRDDSNLRAWLFVVARNTWRKHRRFVLFDAERRNQLRWSLSALAANSTAAANAAATDETPRASDAQLTQALERLAPADREIVLLANESDASQAELAALLGISAAALRQRLSRARKRLAIELTRLITEEGAA